VILNLSEDEFWRSTPKKIGMLWSIHCKFNGWKFKDEEKVQFIDEIPFL